MKAAAVDIGTNSIRLLKAEVNGKELVSGDKSLIMTRIGQGVNETGKLSPEAIERSVKALGVFAKEARAWGAEKIYALATSAVRDAENKRAFTERVKRECGLDVEIISGTHEARLGYLGVLAGLSQLDDRVLIVDVGGGSTELIVGDSKGILFSKSLNVGAVRMTGKHISTDPVSGEELSRLQRDIRQLAEETLQVIQTYAVGRAIGIGGTATTLGAMQLEMETYNRFKIQNSTVTLTDISAMNGELAQKSVEERKAIKGLQPKRADIILAGALIIEHVLDTLGLPKLYISDYDNLEGCLVERLVR